MNTYGGFHKVGFSLKLKFGPMPMSCFQFSRDPWTRVDNVRRYTYCMWCPHTVHTEGTGTGCTCILYGANNDQRKGGEQ